MKIHVDHTFVMNRVTMAIHGMEVSVGTSTNVHLELIIATVQPLASTMMDSINVNVILDTPATGQIVTILMNVNLNHVTSMPFVKTTKGHSSAYVILDSLVTASPSTLDALILMNVLKIPMIVNQVSDART